MKLFFVVNTKYSNLEPETKFAEIGYELSDMQRFKDRQADLYFQNFANFGAINFHNACTRNNKQL